MRHRAPDAVRLRSGRWILVSFALVLTLGACGSASGGGGEGGGGSDEADKVLAEASRVFGTSMKGGSLEGTTITIVLADQFGAGGARLFMCADIKKALAVNDPGGTLTAVMVTESGTQLAASAECA
jgi:hypothetical protein